MSKNFRTTKVEKDGIKCEILLSDLTVWVQHGWHEVVKEVAEVAEVAQIAEVAEVEAVIEGEENE